MFTKWTQIASWTFFSAVAVRATAPGGWGVPAGEGSDVSGRGQARPGQQNNCIRPDPPVPQCRHCWSQAAVGQNQHGEGRVWGVACGHQSKDTICVCACARVCVLLLFGHCVVKWIPLKMRSGGFRVNAVVHSFPDHCSQSTQWLYWIRLEPRTRGTAGLWMKFQLHHPFDFKHAFMREKKKKEKKKKRIKNPHLIICG